MEWVKFNTHGESCNHAFEVMCNLLFEAWCKKEYGNQLVNVTFVNGMGGDGGVEAYATLTEGGIVGVQSKWFREKIEDSQISQIASSFYTAISIRPELTKYIVCVPRDLGSKRKVKGGKVSQNTEENRWLNLVETLKGKAPNVSVELWTETRIQELMTWPELLGVYRFWFDNSEILDDYFELSYKKATSSWARAKYIPDLYAEGYIHQTVEGYLGSCNLSERKYKEWCKMLGRLSGLRQSYEDLLLLDFPKKEQDICTKIKNDISVLSEWIAVLDKGKEAVRRGIAVPIDEKIGLECRVENIKSSSLRFNRYFHFHSVETLLDNIVDDFYHFSCSLNEPHNNRLILLGDPGSGKTTGIISEVDALLENKSHLPILVHAREFSEGETWGTIIEKTLGLSGSWNEKELLFSLQCAAQLRRGRTASQYDIVSNCVVCVDGIDEAESWEFWKTRIEEVDAYKDLYPRIKFIFLSRPYVFKEPYKLSYRNDFSYIPYYGDVKPDEICDAYFKKYKISIGKNIWIKRLLRTPISVRLFCDIYKESTVEIVDNNTSVITNLFCKKIDLMEERFCRQYRIDRRGTVHTALSEIASLYTENEELSEDEIRKKVGGAVGEYITILLRFLEEEGFIYSFKKQKDIFSSATIYFSWGMQPAFDYLIARKLLEVIERKEQITIEYTSGIYEMLALIVIEEKGKLLFEYQNIKIDDNALFDLVCYTLSNASIRAVSSYRDYLKELMGRSVYHFRELVKRVVIPVSIVDKHPLGAELLDEFLRGFSKAAERDIWWSIPAYLRDNYNADWRAYSEIDFMDVNIGDDDTANTIPLVLAWSLSSVNNEIRQHSRMELVTWGICHPIEFWTLLIRISDVNDEQILEDIFAVAYGIALNQFVGDDYVGTASKWILDEVFSNEGLNHYENSAVRYYCSCIVKIAISRGLEADSVKDTVTPPYKYDMDEEKLAIEAVSAERMGGYSALDYDLSRYVLCDHFDDFFRMNYKTKMMEEDASAFIEKYKLKYGLEVMKVDGLIISLAYQYLKEQGWNPAVFWKYNEPENYGVDSAIFRTHNHATHGARSRIMTVAEKNTWLARHHIECIIANEIKYRDWTSDSNDSYLDDYSYLENFINPYQDYVNKNCHYQEEQWYHMDLLAIPSGETKDKNTIEEWMLNEKVPDFKSWIFDNDGCVMVDTFTNRLNDEAGIAETIWISTGIVEKNKFPLLIDCLKTYSDERNELIGAGGFHAGQDCRCYCTPQEACMIHKDKEVESSVSFQFNGETIDVKKVSTRCLSADEMETEKTFFLPSAIIRSFTGITFGDGYEYKSKKGDIIARYISSGENWGTQQKVLLVNQDILMAALDKEGFKPFWIFRRYKCPAHKIYERYPDILHDTDKTYLAWEDADICYMELEEIRPPQRDFDNSGSEILEQIMSQLKYIDQE